MVQLRMKQAGFSLTEILVALAIIGVMMGGALTLFSQVKKARRTSTEANIRAAKTAIDQYYEDTDTYPSSLKDLVERPVDSKVAALWKGPYMDKELVKDAFKGEYQYSVNPKGSKPPYELYSYGPNGEGAPEEEWIQAKNL